MERVPLEILGHICLYVRRCPISLLTFRFSLDGWLIMISFKDLNMAHEETCHPSVGSTASATKQRPQFSIET